VLALVECHIICPLPPVVRSCCFTEPPHSVHFVGEEEVGMRCSMHFSDLLKDLHPVCLLCDVCVCVCMCILLFLILYMFRIISPLTLLCNSLTTYLISFVPISIIA